MNPGTEAGRLMSSEIGARQRHAGDLTSRRQHVVFETMLAGHCHVGDFAIIGGGSWGPIQFGRAGHTPLSVACLAWKTT